MAYQAYRPNAINRVILCSDGVANVGRTGPESILARIKRDADVATAEAERDTAIAARALAVSDFESVIDGF